MLATAWARRARARGSSRSSTSPARREKLDSASTGLTFVPAAALREAATSRSPTPTARGAPDPGPGSTSAGTTPSPERRSRRSRRCRARST